MQGRRRAGVREAARAIAVSCPHAGDFLNAVPMRKPVRVPTWAMRIAVWRRLGLPLHAPADGRRGRHNELMDNYGDVACNDGELGNAARHTELVSLLYDIMRSVFGANVDKEPSDHADYSPGYRPDLVAFADALCRAAEAWVGDVKLIDPFSSNGACVGYAGGYVSFGNTQPATTEKCLGLKARGAPTDRAFSPATGLGRVEAKDGDYSPALALGTVVEVLLFETMGGFGPGVERLLHCLADAVENRLSPEQYDLTTWSARNWMAYQSQRLSVRLHTAVAHQIRREMGSGLTDEVKPDKLDFIDAE